MTPVGCGVPVLVLADGVLERVATTVDAAAGAGRGPVRRCAAAASLAGATFVVVAAGLADPGNLGTVLRVAEAAGAAGVVLTAGTVDPFSPKVVRASAGALFHLPVVVDAPVGELCRPRAAAAGHRRDRWRSPTTKHPSTPPVAVVLGNEAHGLPPDLQVDGLVSIPHAGRAESLNVAMAAAVVCFEVARRARTADAARSVARRRSDRGAALR